MTSPAVLDLPWAQLPLGDHVLAEGPRWDSVRRRLSWVDIAGGTVSWAIHAGGWGAVERRRVGRMPTAAEPLAGGDGWEVCVDGTVVELAPTGPLGTPLRVVDDFPAVRTNDAIRAPDGRVLVGLFTEDRESLRGGVVAVDPAGGVELLLDGLVTANGMAVTADGVLLVVDTARGTVVRTPLVGGHRAELVRHDGPGRLDGLALGLDEDLWVAVWGEGALHRYSLDGVRRAVVPVPVARPTAVTIADLDGPHLVITTARADVTANVPEGLDPGGRLYATAVPS